MEKTKNNNKEENNKITKTDKTKIKKIQLLNIVIY